METALAGTVAVVPLGSAALHARRVAQRLAAEGAAVVVVAGESDAAVAGALATGLEEAGTGSRRPAVFTLSQSPADEELDALAELVGEVFRAGGAPG